MTIRDDSATPSPQDVEYALLHDARAIHDTASLHFTDFETDGSPAWVLAIVTPRLSSGSATVPGASIKAETGELVVPQGAKAVLLKEGTWKTSASARGHGRLATGTYSWSEPLGQDKRVLLPEDYYSPFVHGGRILFRPAPGKSGIDQFGPVHLLFQEWGQYVAAASAFVKNHEQLFEAGSKTGPAEMNELMALLPNENKLIVVLAFRRLAEFERMTLELARKKLVGSKGHLRAILTYMMITDQKASMSESFVQAIINCLNNATTVDTIRPIVLGAFSAGFLRSADAGIISWSKAVLKQTKRRLNELGTPIEKDPNLLLVFKMMDINQQNQEEEVVNHSAESELD